MTDAADAANAGELLRRVVAALEAAEIPFMVVGSFASTVHGEPRTTQDLDLVIDPTTTQLDVFLASLDPARFYVDADTARDALERRTMFNLIDMATAWKVDLVVRKPRAFSLEEMRRSERVDLLGVAVRVATAEDVIISKLEWANAGGSERQLADVVGILRVRGEDLDRAYVERWVTELALQALWRRALALARSG